MSKSNPQISFISDAPESLVYWRRSVMRDWWPETPQFLRDFWTELEQLDEDTPYNNLKDLIHTVRKSELSYALVGAVASKIKRFRLWKDAACDSFKEFCEKILHGSHWYFNRLIHSAQVVVTLIEAGFKFLPRNEAQCRPLVKVMKNQGEDKLIETWEFVTKSLPPHRITQASINEILNEINPPKQKKIPVDPEIYDRFTEAAAQSGQSPGEFLEELLDDYNATDDPDPDALQDWEADLEDLAAEGPATEDESGQGEEAGDQQTHPPSSPPHSFTPLSKVFASWGMKANRSDDPGGDAM